MQFFYGTNIDFVGKRKIFFIFSTILIVAGIAASLAVGVQYGIDFEGGTEMAYKFDKPLETNQLRTVIENAGFEGAEIKSFGEDNQYLIRVKESHEATKKVNEALAKNMADMNYEVLKSDNIGPKIGKELRGQAFWAVGFAVIAILIYIAFRFEFVFGLGAIVALVHDVVVTFIILVILNKVTPYNLDINQSILAAMLTVVGYSINDTVIIFDRIRENRDRIKGKGVIQMVNISINETLTRTVNTVATSTLVLITIILFGGPVLKGFALTMFIGVLTGTYSSIYIASSFVIWYLGKVKKVNLEKGLASK